jgi:1-acyl-sn-glycerol-3-phosphate acyltransferase
MKILRGIYTGYAMVVFSILFAIFFLLLCFPIAFPSQHKWVGILNRWWARLLFMGVGIPWKVEYRQQLDPKRQFIFCPNHFSYADIPVMGLNRINTIFVGKNDMENIPLFGFMYRKLHITVDRGNMSSRISTYKKSLRALDEGKSLVIYPEGGIVTHKDPVMGKFKNGAFKAAIEKQIPIVPVTLPYNWILLPPDEFLMRWHPVKLIFHEPVETKGLTAADTESLKNRVFAIIDNELSKHLK